MNEVETKRRLAEVEAAIVKLTDQLRQLEGWRDTLRRALADNEGLHDRQRVGVR